MALNSPHERTAQKLRTRHAIVTAAAELLGEAESPTVTQIAAAAEVSRRTIYLHFPSIEHLLLEAALQSTTQESVDAALDDLGDEPDVEHRVDVLTRAVQELFFATEKEGRTLLRLTVDAPREGPADQPVRGARRIEWIERAVEPLRFRLEPTQFERLVTALAMVVGWEALIVARDIRALQLPEAEETSAWAARALVRAALEQSSIARPAIPLPPRAARNPSGHPQDI